MAAVGGGDRTLDRHPDRSRGFPGQRVRGEVGVEVDEDVALFRHRRATDRSRRDEQQGHEEENGEASAHRLFSLRVVVAEVGRPFGSLPHSCACLSGGRARRVTGGRQSLARLAADHVAEGVLEALGAAARRESFGGALMLLRVSPAVAAPRPGLVGLAEAAGPVEGDREDEEADRPMQDPALEEAECDQGNDDRGADGAGEQRLHRAVFDRQRREADQDQHHPGGGDHGGVDRLATLLGPVDVVEVDPEGELVDRQAGPDAKEDGADLGPGRMAEGEKSAGSGDHHRHDPEDEVMKVDAAVADDAPRPPGDAGAALQPGAHADEGEGADEADEDDEQPLLVVLFQLAPEVGENRGGGHAGAGAACGGGAVPSLRAISSTVSKTAATAKIGERKELAMASASQLARKVSPSSRWTSPASPPPIASPRISIGSRTQRTSQKLPRTSWTLRRSAPTAHRSSISMSRRVIVTAPTASTRAAILIPLVRSRESTSIWRLSASRRLNGTKTSPAKISSEGIQPQ